MSAYLLVAVGGALGSMARYWCSGFVAARWGETYPWGTLAVNVTGSFVIGAFGALSGPDSRFLIGPSWRLFVMVGICGGYTTFSSFSLQTLQLMRDGEQSLALANILGSVVTCLVAVWAGMIAGELVGR